REPPQDVPPPNVPPLPPANDDRADKDQPQQEQDNDFDWELFVKEAIIGVAKGVVVVGAAAGAVAAGFVSTPAVVVFGIVAAIGTGINTFLVRGNEAMDAGEEDWVGRAVTAGVSDMVPVVDPVGWAEVVTGYNYMTGQE